MDDRNVSGKDSPIIFDLNMSYEVVACINYDGMFPMSLVESSM